ncbi:MAG: hypothetical protein AAB250_02705 [Bdellovibrionota bacterium]
MSTPLLRTPFANSILDGRTDMKIFSSYEDPRAHRLLASYGMRKSKRVVPHQAKFEVMPWVTLGRSKVEVFDPHRGTWKFKVDRSVEAELVECGWAQASAVKS